MSSGTAVQLQRVDAQMKIPQLQKTRGVNPSPISYSHSERTLNRYMGTIPTFIEIENFVRKQEGSNDED